MRRGLLPPPDHMESKIAAQVVEIERLTRENRRLAGTHMSLRQDLVSTQQEMQRLEAHMGSIQTESDIQIRMLLEKIKKMEADIRAGESMNIDLQQAHKEAQSLVATREELASEIQQATQELRKAHTEFEQLPELHVELNKLRQEHRMLRGAFEYEKGLNMEKVEQLHTKEKNLISMAREVEKLRNDVSTAEKGSHAPQSSAADSSYPPSNHGGGAYVDSYGRSQMQKSGGFAGNGFNPYGSNDGVVLK